MQIEMVAAFYRANIEAQTIERDGHKTFPFDPEDASDMLRAAEEAANYTADLIDVVSNKYPDQNLLAIDPISSIVIFCNGATADDSNHAHCYIVMGDLAEHVRFQAMLKGTIADIKNERHG